MKIMLSRFPATCQLINHDIKNIDVSQGLVFFGTL